MHLERLGDSAYIARDLNGPPYLLANALNANPPIGLLEAVASYETVGLYVDPFQFDPKSLRDTDVAQFTEPKTHAVPVCYGLGPDIGEVCSRLNLTMRQVVELHTSSHYQCYAVGFCPGFAYLGYLPEPLSRLPRRANPRTAIEPGSVAITGRQTAVYPLLRPGGWSLIGQTPLVMVDVEKRYFPIQAGDLVRFYAISESEYEARKGERL